jgi:AraC-like DNA-binding protein
MRNFWQTIERSDCNLTGISAHKVRVMKTSHFRTYQRNAFPFREGVRLNCALTYVREGCYHYESEGISFECHPGEMTFLPAGSSYHHVNSRIPSAMSVIYFTLTNADGSPYELPDTSIRKITCADPKAFERLFTKVQDRFFSMISSNFLVKGELYRILSALAREEQAMHLTEGEIARLSPALDILSKPETEPLTVSHLAEACQLSEYAFRELFKKYAGIPPKVYLMERRVERVEALLQVRDITVTEAALYCGFEDPTYFFKLYRRMRGHPPGKNS